MNEVQTQYRPMWIILEVTDLRKQASEKVTAIVQEMGGTDIQAYVLFDLVVVAKFPHRRYRAVEKAVAAAVNTLQVKNTTVYGRNPYALRKPPGPVRRRGEAVQAQQGKAIIDVLFEVG